METTVWDSIAATPWWIYLLMFLMIRATYHGTKSRAASYKASRNMSILFFLITTASLIPVKLYTLPDLAHWFGMLVVGIIAGFAYYKLLRVSIISGDDIFRLPGNWFGPFITLGLIYSYYRYRNSFTLDLDQLANPHFMTWLPASYGLFTGLMIGKVLYLRGQTRASICAGTHSASASRS